LPVEFKQQHPEVEWNDIAAFRNIAVHAYFTVSHGPLCGRRAWKMRLGCDGRLWSC
jgi:hypothetical protein